MISFFHSNSVSSSDCSLLFFYHFGKLQCFIHRFFFWLLSQFSLIAICLRFTTSFSASTEIWLSFFELSSLPQHGRQTMEAYIQTYCAYMYEFTHEVQGTRVLNIYLLHGGQVFRDYRPNQVKSISKCICTPSPQLPHFNLGSQQLFDFCLTFILVNVKIKYLILP